MSFEQLSLVSIIMPAYNTGHFIADSINSVINQTYSNWELIIINDCSNDNTLSVIASFNDKRISLINNNKICGAAYSRNIGIKQAKGDYIAFLDSDDLWVEDKLDKQLRFMQKGNISFSCASYKIEGTQNKVVRSPKIITHKKLKRCNYIGCLTVIYKRDIYPEISIPDSITKRNDYAFWLKLTEKAPCSYFDDVLGVYRKNKNSLSSGCKIKLFKYHIDMWRKLYNFSVIKSFCYSLRNTVFYWIKKIKYLKT